MLFGSSTSLTVFLFSNICFLSVFSQSNENDQLGGFVPPGYEEVSTKSSGSIGAIEKCGEGASRGVDLCVPYYQCDSNTRMIIEVPRTDGFGIIDIRFGEDKPCDHYLDICCGIPKNGIPSSTTDREAPVIDVESPPPDPVDPTPIVPSSEKPITETPGPRPTPHQPWSCGIRNDNGIDFQITGNKNHESEYGEFPWMVAIVKSNYNPPNDNLLVCGGSLITPNVVLTAAHCVHKLKTHEIKARVGEWDTQTDKERLPYQERNIKEIIIHEQFRAQVLFNDVALLVLDYPVEESENVGIICLPQTGEEFNSKECIATGWGKDKFGKEGIYQAILKKIVLPTVPFDECQEKLRTTRLGKYFILDKSFRCAGGELGQDTCTGDGGSPLICPDPYQAHRYIQIGMVAWGIGCGEQIPAVYVDVVKFRSWIDGKLSAIGPTNK